MNDAFVVPLSHHLSAFPSVAYHRSTLFTVTIVQNEERIRGGKYMKYSTVSALTYMCTGRIKITGIAPI
jgi:hypothetical protein